MQGLGEDLTSIFESITDAFFALDKEWRFAYLNSEAERVLFRKREDLLGKNVWEEFPESVDSAFYREYHKAVAERVTVEFEEYYPPLETWFAVTAYPSEAGLLVYFRDINERRRAEEALKESERRLDAVLIQYGSDIITILEADGTIRFESPAVEKALGYRPEELTGTKIFDHVHPDSVELARSRFGKLLERPGNYAPVEYRFRHKDGSWRYFEGIGNNLLDDPDVRGIVVNSRDVTGRRRAEERLRASEAEMRALFAAMRDVVLVLDAQGRYVTIASTDPLLLYTPASERIGKTVHEVLPKKLADTFLDHIRRALRARRTVHVEYSLRIDGRLKWFSAVVSPMPEDKVVWVARDVTERKEAEEALKESEERFRQIFEQSVDALLVHDEDERIMDCNAEACRSLGYSYEEMLSLSVKDFASNLASGEEQLVSRSGALWQHVEASEIHEILSRIHLAEYRRKDGTTFPVAVRVSYIDYGGKRMMLASVRDITKVKQTMEALRESEEHFRSLVQNGSDIITIVEGDGTISYESPSVERMLGYRPENLVGTNVFDYVHADDRERAVQALAGGLSIAGTTGKTFECRFRHADGSWRHLEGIGNNLLDHPSVKGIVINSRDVTDRKQAEEALRHSEKNLAAAQQIAHIGSWEYDADKDEVRWSDEVYRIFGFSPGQFVPTRRKHLEFVHPEDREYVERSKRDPYRNRRQTSTEYRIVKLDGEVRVVQNHREVGLDEEGRLIRITGTVQDVTEFRRKEEELRRNRNSLSSAQRIAHVGNWEYAVEEDEAMWSDEMYRIFGFSPQQFVPTYRTFLNFVHPDDKALIRRAVREALYGGKRTSLEYRIVRPEGTVRHVHSQYETLRDGSDKTRRLLGTVHDVTERKALEQQLEYRAFHDLVTGLPNRALLMNRLEHALARTGRRERKVAVLFMDLDNFKFVNDSLGHHVGDRLLAAVSERLRTCLRPEDTAARLGGDEFVVLLEDVEHVNEATRVAGRIIEELRASFVLNGQEVFSTPSIGIALSGSGQDLIEDLLRSADIVMYRAKEEGKARYRVFEPSMEVRTTERLMLENDLRRGLERDEFRVCYQPVVRLDTERIIGMEALVRWEHPERGLRSPSEFVPLAEEVGLIVPIGRWVLREACRQAREWEQLYPSNPPLLIGVNLSARQLQHPELVRDVEEALRESELDPERLTLEITESAVVGDEERHIDTLRRLRDLGVRFALDDFGTGYSSLSYLKLLPVGLLKIDSSFVERIGEDAEDEVLLSGVISIASGLGLSVLAEGVKTSEQLARLRALGCDLAQGNYFSEPLPSEAAGELLATYDN